MKSALPTRLSFTPEGPRVEWVFTDGSPFTEPFFEQTVQRLKRLPINARAARPVTPLSALLEVGPGVPLAGLIFHVSRCGSTLLAQMLAALPRHIVVAEAPVLDDILRAPRRDPRVTDEERIAWLRQAVAALGQRKTPQEERLFVKLDCWSIFELPLLSRAFPSVPLLFLHRHPTEVLVSLLHRPSITLIRDTVTPGQLGLTAIARDSLSREEHAAAILGAFFRTALAQRAALTPVSYEQLTDFVRTAMPGCTFAPDEQTLLREAAARDAKNPAQTFRADSAAKRQSADPAIVAAASRFSLPAYVEFLASCPDPLPLPSTLD